MTDKPILFSGQMVRALLEGRKTQTRRVLCLDDDHRLGSTPYVAHGRPSYVNPETGDGHRFPRSYATGTRLWVREAFCLNPAVRHLDRRKNVIFQADVPTSEPPLGGALTIERARWLEALGLKWKPSIHMPRWASRLTLTVTDVRVQRVQEISEEDACAEGCAGFYSPMHEDHGVTDGMLPSEEFRTLWDSLNASRGFGWQENPWVAAYSFEVQKRNIDE